MKRLRLTTAQALVRFLMSQQTIVDGRTVPLLHGMFAIFGHGNVAGMGEALAQVRDRFPTLRAHNEQAMAHAAIAYAKAHRRRRMMACTTSIGPGATNMVTAAALAHVNRLPVLLLPGDVFASRRPDPVLQQVEDFADGTVSANDCFRPVSRYWDRITRPEQLLRALPEAISVLTDPADCGPVTLALPQDVQAEAADFPESFFESRMHVQRRNGADAALVSEAARRWKQARRPFLIAGGGVHYSGACDALGRFAERFGVAVAETQAGKGALRFDHPCNAGAVGVTGSAAANALAAEADLIVAVGTRLQDFTTGSAALFADPTRPLIAINVCRRDGIKYGALHLQGDAQRTLDELSREIEPPTDDAWRRRIAELAREWREAVDRATADDGTDRRRTRRCLAPSTAGSAAKERSCAPPAACRVSCTSSGAHRMPTRYHLEYGYSCMGYEIAGGLGVKLARPAREVVVLVGDGSYLMMNSEIATSIALGLKLTVVVLDNRGFGCISRLQQACGSESFNNLLDEPAACAGDRLRRARAGTRCGRRARDGDSGADGRARPLTGRASDLGRRDRDECRTRDGRRRRLVGRPGGRGVGERNGAARST